jgi:hypothetical protein
MANQECIDTGIAAAITEKIKQQEVKSQQKEAGDESHYPAKNTGVLLNVHSLTNAKAHSRNKVRVSVDRDLSFSAGTCSPANASLLSGSRSQMPLPEDAMT